MIVYGLFYNSCIYESAPALQSLHATKEGADRAYESFMKEYLKNQQEQINWEIEQGYDCTKPGLSDHQRLFVEEIEVFE